MTKFAYEIRSHGTQVAVLYRGRVERVFPTYEEAHEYVQAAIA